jgi:hypothetical protein
VIVAANAGEHRARDRLRLSVPLGYLGVRRGCGIRKRDRRRFAVNCCPRADSKRPSLRG